MNERSLGLQLTGHEYLEICAKMFKSYFNLIAAPKSYIFKSCIGTFYLPYFFFELLALFLFINPKISYNLEVIDNFHYYQFLVNFFEKHVCKNLRSYLTQNSTICEQQCKKRWEVILPVTHEYPTLFGVTIIMSNVDRHKTVLCILVKDINENSKQRSTKYFIALDVSWWSSHSKNHSLKWRYH